MFLFCSILGCGADEATEGSPRETYNRGTAALAEQKFEDAAELLLKSRDEAGTDAVLRQAAAYNLALTHAQHGAAQEAEDPQKARELYSQAVSWFQDTLRLNPEDTDARINLEVVQKRLQLLADKLNAGKNNLEARLDRHLEDGRSARDQIRSLRNQIDASGDKSDPSGYRDQFDTMAVYVRGLQADMSTTLGLCSDERSNIQNKAEEEQSAEEKTRFIQLSNLEAYLSLARDEIADARRVLRRLDAVRGLTRLEKAVRHLKRAKEQLADPIAVLKVLTQEQQELAKQTTILQLSNKGMLQLQAQANQPPPKLPSWFNSSFLTDTQAFLDDRASEIMYRFEAAAEAPEPTEQEQANAEQQEMLTLVKDALPSLKQAVDSMRQAKSSLQADNLTTALQHEYAAITSLGSAIERFADAKTLIELAYANQEQLIVLLTPPSADQPANQQLSTEERSNMINKGMEENEGRISRLQAALTREKAKREQQLQAAAAQAQQQGQAAPDPEQDPLAQNQALFEEAERLRSAAATALGEMKAALLSSADPLPAAKQAQDQLHQLRILFFSIVEHMQELAQQQNNTRDKTSEAAAKDYEKLLEDLSLISPRQDEHLNQAKALAEALQSQADSAAENQQAEQAEQAEALANAYAEMGIAIEYMQGAGQTIEETRTEAGGMSHDVEPALEDQQKAVEHIMAAIQALQPPQQQEGDDQQKQDEQVGQQQAERRLQAAREREAERAAKRQQGGAQAPVEKDW